LKHVTEVRDEPIAPIVRERDDDRRIATKTSGATVESDDVDGLGFNRMSLGKRDESSARFGLRVAVWCAKFQVSFKRSAGSHRLRVAVPVAGGCGLLGDESARACQGARMSDFVTGDRPDGDCLHGGDRSCLAVKRRELDFERLAVRVNVNHSAHIADFKAFSRNGRGQNDSIVLLDHHE